MTAPLRAGIAVAAGVIAVVVASLVAGGWWAAFVAGLVVGAVLGRAWIALVAGAAIGLLSWGVPLAVDGVRYGAGGTAGALTAILGFGHQGAYSILLTLVVGLLLGLTGAWLGSAARGLVVASGALVDARKS